MPYYDNAGGLVRPCAYFADLVENRCPYMSPHGEHQYAGESLFLSSRQYYTVGLLRNSASLSNRYFRVESFYMNVFVACKPFDSLVIEILPKN